jgi:hypothetical protein
MVARVVSCNVAYRSREVGRVIKTRDVVVQLQPAGPQVALDCGNPENTPSRSRRARRRLQALRGANTRE